MKIIFTLTAIYAAFVAGCIAGQAHGAGTLNLNVVQGNIYSTICVPGWAASVRPSAAYTQALKRANMKLWHLPGTIADYELDHWIPLSLGGAPSDPNNLKMQPWPEARRKDVMEIKLHRMVCAGQISLARAQKLIGDWR